MNSKKIHFSASSTQFFFEDSIRHLKKIADAKNTVIITDENIFQLHEKHFKHFKTIALPPGEKSKTQATVNSIISWLIDFEADRKTTLVGVGGGVITDLTGYVASIFMRGVAFGFIPTTLLSLVDASIGGKNGIDIGLFKNMVGTVKQPNFILHDINFLSTLPQSEWHNGFAEIIKHACIKDAAMFKELESGSLQQYQKNKKMLQKLIRRNAMIKIKIVQQDEFEVAERKLLNFGHTLAHALENLYELPHGQAVAIGMIYASKISQQFTGFKDAPRIAKVLAAYGLPVFFDFDVQKVMDVLKKDKKRERKAINYILLNKIGKAIIQPIPLADLEKFIQAYKK